MPDIKVKGYSGSDLSYTNVPKIYLRAADDSGNIPYTYGDAVSKTVEDLDFSETDAMAVDIADGELVTELTIAKPDTLIAENIRYGKEIAGVTGEFLGDTEETTVDLAMADGDQVIEPTEEGKVLTKVTITKPDGAEQVIAKGEILGGIVGEYVTPGTIKEIEPDFSEGDHTENADGDERWNEVIVKMPETLISENVRSGIDVGGVVGSFLGDTEEATVTLDFSEGNQTVEPSEDGKVLSSVTIQQPDTLVPSNIASGVEIAGVVGEFVGGDVEAEEVTVDLNMTDGNQVVEPSWDGLMMSKVTINKPDTLVPENIAEGIDIAGIVGTFAGGGDGYKIIVKEITGSTTLSAAQTLLTADELSSIGFESAENKFVLLFDIDGSTIPVTASRNMMTFNFIRYPFVMQKNSSTTHYGYYSYRYKYGSVNSLSASAIAITSTPWGSTVKNSVYYKNGAICYYPDSIYLTLSTSASNTYYVIAGCY